MYIRCFAALFLLFIPTFLPAAADTAEMQQLLRNAPAATLGSLLTSSLQGLYDQLKTLESLPGMSEVTRGMGIDKALAEAARAMHAKDVSDLASFAKVLGIDVNRPTATYLSGSSGFIGAILPLASDTPIKSLIEANAGTNFSPLKAGKKDAFFNDTDNVGFYLDGDNLVISSSATGLNAMAAATEANVAWKYPGEAFPAVAGEVALVSNLKTAALAPLPADLERARPAIAALSEQFDEALAAVQLKDNKALVRLAARDLAPGEEAALAPLELYNRFEKGLPAVGTLRFSPGLKSFIKGLLVAFKAPPQVAPMYDMIAMQALGEEVAFAFHGLKENGTPRYTVLISAPAPEKLVLVTALTGLGAPAEEQYNGVDIQHGTGLTQDLGIYLCQIEKTVVVGNELGEIKRLIDAKGAPAKDPVAIQPDVLKQGNHGFILLNGRAGMEMLAALARRKPPVGLSENLPATTLTIEGHQGWRQIALLVPDAKALATVLAAPQAP